MPSKSAAVLILKIIAWVSLGASIVGGIPLSKFLESNGYSSTVANITLVAIILQGAIIFAFLSVVAEIAEDVATIRQNSVNDKK